MAISNPTPAKITPKQRIAQLELEVERLRAARHSDAIRITNLRSALESATRIIEARNQRYVADGKMLRDQHHELDAANQRIEALKQQTREIVDKFQQLRSDILGYFMAKDSTGEGSLAVTKYREAVVENILSGVRL